MQFHWPFRMRGGTTEAASSPIPRVVHGSVVVYPDGTTTFMSELPPEEFAGGSADLLRWVPDEDRARFGRLPSEAFVGTLIRRDARRGPLFVSNQTFYEFLQYGMAAIGPTLPALQEAAAAARRAGGRNLFLYDARNDDWLRTNPHAMPPDDEAIGAFLIGEGPLTEQSYLRNTRYNWWSERGPTQIPVPFLAPLVTRLVALEESRRAKPH